MPGTMRVPTAFLPLAMIQSKTGSKTFTHYYYYHHHRYYYYYYHY
jgi:hypothetical protein